MSIQSVVYKHLSGQHNQKRHGWRYSSVEEARRAMRSGISLDFKDKVISQDERDAYRARTKWMSEKISKQELMDKIYKMKRDVAWARDKDSETTIISTPYNEKMVKEIKSLPVTDRKWDASVWVITNTGRSDSMEKSVDIVKKYFRVVDNRGISDQKERTKRIETAREERINAAQYFLKQKKVETAMRDRIQKIDNNIDNASRSRKSEMETERNFLYYALSYRNKKFSELDDIAKNTIMKAARLYVLGLNE